MPAPPPPPLPCPFPLSMPLSPLSLLLCPESPNDVASWDSNERAPLPPSSAAGSRAIDLLLATEADHLPLLSPNPTPRHNAVNWILNVNEFYRFRPATAVLAVNYLDRFLSSNTLPGQNGESGGWPMQLLSVACVSVAAKMEETHVPLLFDLQILDPKFVFEPKTIMRMELLLMSALKWRMSSVTPFDFVEHFADFVKPATISVSRAGLIPSAADLIVKTCRVVEFLEYRPSEIAAAAIICAAKKIADISDGGSTDFLGCFNEWVNEERVRACLELMIDSLIDMCPFSHGGKPHIEPRTPPQSPVGVIDAAACKSRDSQKSSSSTLGHNFNRTEPSGKRRRLYQTLCTESRDKDGQNLKLE